MKRSVTEKMAGEKQKTKKSNENQKNSRFLIAVNVLGSAGPFRFMVNEKESVAGVIDTALKLYRREGRVPTLGTDVNNFQLYPANAGLDALNPSEVLGSNQGRNFVMCKKQIQPAIAEARSETIASKRSGCWRAWLHKPFHFKISSH